MASSKSLFLLFSVLVLLISSEVEAAGQESVTGGVVDARYVNQGNGYGDTGSGDLVCPIRRCRYGCCSRCRYSPGCIRCCSSAHEAPDAEIEDDVKN